MITVLGFYKRKPGLTHEQFCDHWRNVHGPLIRRIPNIEKSLIRYVQHHLTPDPAYPVPEGMDFDGFSEGVWVDRKAMEDLYALPFFLKDVIDDERKFIDMDATRWYVTDEQHVIIAGPGA